MATKLNKRAFEHAKDLIMQGKYVFDERDAWSEHQPTTQEENEFLESHGIGEYSKWFLGIDDEQNPEKKSSYKFPYGDFKKVHRCGVLSAESRAGQYKYQDIENAAAHLHGILDGIKSKES